MPRLSDFVTLFFTQSAETTAIENAQIALIEGSVRVRNRSAIIQGEPLEASDYVAGAVPAAYGARTLYQSASVYNLVASANAGGNAVLSWVLPAGTVLTQTLLRSVDGGAFTDISAGLSASSTTFTDTLPVTADGKNYRYQLRATVRVADGNSATLGSNVIVVVAVAPVVVSRPAIAGAGTQTVGSVFTATAAVFTGAISTVRSWLKNGTAVASTATLDTTTGYVATDVITMADIATNSTGSTTATSTNSVTLTAVVVGGATYRIAREDSTGFMLLEDGTGYILLEAA